MSPERTSSVEKLIHKLSTLRSDLIDHSPLPMAAAVGEKHVIGYVNPAYCNLVGKKKEDLIGHPFAETGPEIERFMAIMDRVYRTGKAEAGAEQENSASHLRNRPYVVWALPDTDGRPVGIVIQLMQLSIHSRQLTAMNQELMLSAVRQHEIIDEKEDLNAALQAEITERKLVEGELKKSEELLRETNKELESFSYSVSHDLQAPLRAIKGFSQMILQDEEGAGAETKQRLTVIHENAERMQRLIESLLAMSRVGRRNLSFNWFDMDALVKDVWKEIEGAYPEKPLVLKTQDIQRAYGDQALIRQLLANLLSNAVKYSANRMPIEVEVGSYQMDEGNVYYVKDKGIGFNMKYHDKLFGVFQRLHSASEFKGTGIGLSIAQRIVHLHGGRIWAEGKVDKGAAFYFLLPRESKNLSR
jgi:two-component system sensor kinase